MASQVNTRWGLKTTDRQLKKIGRDNLAQYLIEQAEKAIAEVDLIGRAGVPGPTTGACSSIVRLGRATSSRSSSTRPDLDGEGSPTRSRRLLHGKVLDVYRQKEIEFPVKVAMARFMADAATAAPAGPALRPRRPVPLVPAALPPRRALTEEEFPHPVAGQAAGDAARGQPQAVYPQATRRRSTTG